ncbi:hypothetical protein D3C87_1454240 [compost metagenome]
MSRKAVAGVSDIGPFHHPVARHLGDDRCRGDRERAGVALDHRLGVTAKAGRHIAAIDQHEARGQRQAVDGPAHRLEACLADVDGIDGRGRGRGDGNGGGCQDLVEQSFACRSA